MADRSVLWWWKVLAAGCCLASSVAGCAATAASRAAEVPSSAIRLTVSSRATGPQLRELQMNLCNSGIATCYTGRSVAAAAALIRDQRPDIVTVNEVCRGDVSRLKRAMSDSHRGAVIASAFKAAGDRDTNGAYRCRNGQKYGIGVLATIAPSASGYRTYGGIYPNQTPDDPEERVWVCIHADSAFYACTTHLASNSTSVALAQCRYFLQSAVPAIRSQGGADPVILGADFNLPAGGSPDPRSCLPARYQRLDDGSRQEVVTSPGVTLGSHAVIGMHGTTDHPALLVELALSH